MDLQAVEGKYHVHHHHRHHHHHDLTTAPTCHRLRQVEMMDHQRMDLQAVEGKDHVHRHHRHHDLTTAPTCHHTTTQNQTGQESHLLLELHFVTKVPDYRLTMALQAVEDIHLLLLRLLALVMVLRRSVTETHKDADYTLVSFSKKLTALATGGHL
jgi:hypothetical protein